MCPAFRHQIMRFMRNPMQPFHTRVLSRTTTILENKSRYRPDGIQFGFPINEVFEFRRDFEQRHDLPECLNREIANGHNVRRVRHDYDSVILFVWMTCLSNVHQTMDNTIRTDV